MMTGHTADCGKQCTIPDRWTMAVPYACATRCITMYKPLHAVRTLPTHSPLALPHNFPCGGHPRDKQRPLVIDCTWCEVEWSRLHGVTCVYSQLSHKPPGEQRCAPLNQCGRTLWPANHEQTLPRDWLTHRSGFQSATLRGPGNAVETAHGVSRRQ